MRGTDWSDKKVTQVLERFAIAGRVAITAREEGVPPSTVGRWVKKHAARVAEMKRRNAEIHERVTEESIEEMAERHAKAGVRLQDTGLVMLDEIKLEDASGFEATRLVTAGIDVERTARGEPTEIHELNVWDKIEAEIEKEGHKMSLCMLCGGQIERCVPPKRGKGAYCCTGCGTHMTKAEYAFRQIVEQPCPLCGGQVKDIGDQQFKCSGCSTVWKLKK